MRTREVVLAETACIEQRHRERVAECHLSGGAGSWREVQRAGFLIDPARQHDVGMAGQRRLGVAGHRDQGHVEPLQRGQQHGELIALAAVGDRQQHIAGLHHAEVAVAGFGRMHEERRRAGGGERGRDLAPDMAALAHAHHDHAALALKHHAHRVHETIALPRRQREQRAGFDLEGLRGQRQRALCIEARSRGHVPNARLGSGILGRTSRGTRTMATMLEVVLLYLVAAVAGVVLCRSLKLPPMLGYLAVGVLIGPNALSLAGDPGGARALAEFGVVFLMFVIGLEFNLPKLRSMRALVFGLGMSQVGLTILGAVVGNGVLVAGFAALGRAWDLSWQGAIALGAAIAMSSTAILVKLMAERLELDSEHGRRVLGVLLFQDLAVVPLLVLIPALGTGGATLATALAIAFAKAAVLLTLLLVGGQVVMRWWLTQVARLKSEELFVLNLLLVTLGLAWLTEAAGLSLALGAFIAGMLVAETEYKHQVETDIRPFHDVLLGLFFITIGMRLDWRPLVDQWFLVLMLTTLPVLAKAVLVALLARAFRGAPGTAIRTGLYLAQAGEFGFVLLALGVSNNLLVGDWMSPVLAAMVLSMLSTPFLVMWSGRIVMRLSSSDWM